MKTFQIDAHHVVLYVLLLCASGACLGTLHSWRMDLNTAKVRSEADAKATAQIEKDREARAKQYEAQLQLLETQRIKPSATPPAPRILVERLGQLEPQAAIVPDQLVSPPGSPEAPKENLSLTPSQQVTLINSLVDCRECQNERAKLRQDLADQTAITKKTADERDAYKTAAQGGSLKQRLVRRFWHFVEDAAVIEALRLAGGRP